jgi:hypothetical protein
MSGSTKNFVVKYCFAHTHELDSPNLTLRKKDLAPAEFYYRCMFVSAASVRRWNPSQEIMVVTNRGLPTEYASDFKSLGVTIEYQRFDSQPDPALVSAFRTSSYTLDVLTSSNEDVMLVDPDTVCLGSLSPLLEAAGGKIAGLTIDYDLNRDVNGMSRRQAQLIAETLLRRQVAVFPHLGGEFLFVPRFMNDFLTERLNELWELNKRLALEAKKIVPTEEHFFSIALADQSVFDVHPFVRRIWTAHRYRRIPENFRDLLIWHLPAEKTRGFREMFNVATDRSSWFWSTDHEEFVDQCANTLHLKNRSPLHFLKDTIGRFV